MVRRRRVLHAGRKSGRLRIGKRRWVYAARAPRCSHYNSGSNRQEDENDQALRTRRNNPNIHYNSSLEFTIVCSTQELYRRCNAPQGLKTFAPNVKSS